MGKLPNPWTDREKTCNKYTYSSGYGNRLIKLTPRAQWTFEGDLGITNSKISDICQTAGPIVNKFGTRTHIRLHVNGHIWLQKSAPRDKRGILEGEIGVTY